MDTINFQMEKKVEGSKNSFPLDPLEKAAAALVSYEAWIAGK